MTNGTEVAVRRPQANVLPAKIQYARALADSGLLPESYRRQPANVLWAMEFAEMLHLPPMVAMTGVHVIEGKPTASAGLISALVRRAGHKLRVGYDASKMTGWAEVVRSDDPDFTYRSEWDLDRAVTAELCTVKDGKPHAVDSKGRSKPWRKFFPSMTKARAITEVARDACEEVLFGLHYTPEELGAEVDEDGAVLAVVVDEPAQQNGSQDDPWNVHPVPETDAAEEWIAASLRIIPDIGLDACRKLWREAREKVRDGELTEPGSERVLAPLKERMEALANPPQDAEVVSPTEPETVPPVAAALGPDDPWTLKVEGLSSDEEAATALDEATELLAAGEINAERFGAIEDTITARFPGAGTERDEAA